jgi:enoyl-CoA hydratase
MIDVERDGDVVVVRPDVPPLNLIGRDLMAALQRTFADLHRETPRVVALHCTGGGANVKELVELDRQTARSFITELHEACAAIRLLDTVVLGVVDGPCMGAHMEVAAACDLRVCSQRSIFAMPEILVGIPSVIDACWLQHIVGLGEASKLVFDGRPIDADEAYRIRFVNRVGEPSSAIGWAHEIAHASPIASRQQKRVMRDWTQAWYEEAVRASIERFVETFEHGEANEAMRAFLEKREPRF